MAEQQENSGEEATLESLSETLDTELKGWLDLDDPRQAALFAKACIALRNNDGGRIILGVDDTSAMSISADAPSEVRSAYHTDKVNEVVGRYAVPKFEVRVVFKTYQQRLHPEVTVSSGVQSPVITRSPFERELRQNAVYVRTVSNGRPSSCEPKTADDWNKLMRTCFDNREADIGRFVRRHLSQIFTELQQAGAIPPTENRPLQQPEQSAIDFLEVGSARLRARWAEKVGDNGPEANPPFHGLREAACVVKGVTLNLPMQSLLNTIFVHQPRMTGWPPWIDSRSFRDAKSHPYVTQKGWEALVYGLNTMWSKEGAVDFWRIEPTGRFYTTRTYEDDTTKQLHEQGVKPGVIFDFLLLVARTAEIIATARAFVQGCGVDQEKARLEFAFRWTGLRGRNICSWVNPGRGLNSFVTAEDDEVLSTTTVPQELPNNLLWQAVKSVTQPVFEIFATEIGDGVFEDLVNRTLNRQL